ncbi:MAG: Bax inhibitor-1 family protein [Ktedonobacteraceae bacterium]|jgi:modulator of FtsH protease
MFGSSRYQYQQYGATPYEGVQAGSLISKVMGLLAFSFLFAFIGTYVGTLVVTTIATFWIVALGGLAVLFILNFAIQKPGLNLFLLYLFTFLEGMAISPIIGYYLQTNSNILGEAFLITAITSLALAVYAWTTKRDFSGLRDYLFFGVILLLVAGLIGIFFGGIFHTTLFGLIISIFGIAIFSGYVLYYVQRAKYMADTMPNAIGLTVSLFITVLNLFLYILELLSILQGGGRRR